MTIRKTAAWMLGALMAMASGGTAAAGEVTLFAADFATAESVAKYVGEGATFAPGAGPDGRGALRFHMDPRGNRMLNVPLDLAKARGQAVQVEALMKAEDLTPPGRKYLGAKLMLHIRAPGENTYTDSMKEYGTYDWKPFKVFVRVPTDAQELDLNFGVQDVTGSLYFRDLKVYIVPSIDPGSFVKPTAPLQKTPRYRGAMTNNLKEDDVRVFATGFGGNLFRWTMYNPMHKPRDILGREKYLAWLDDEILKLDAILPAMEKYGVKVVIDLHTGPGMTQDVLLRNMLGWDHASQDLLVEAWERLARHYKANPNIYGFDLVNEPREDNYTYEPGGPLDWNRLAARVAKAIRAIDTVTPIVVGPAKWSSPPGFKVFAPIDVDNVIYTVHFYEPHAYTHQGVNQAWDRLSYPGTVLGRHWDIDELRKELQPVVDFQKKYNVPILVGEFSAVIWADGAARYLEDCFTLFEENGWDWAYHAFREWPGWSTEHVGEPPNQFTRVDRTDRMDVLKKYLARNKAPAAAGKD